MMRAVTFDVTGTLISCPDLGRIYSVVLARHWINVEPERVSSTFPVVWRELDCRVATGADRFASHPQGARGFWRDVLARLGEYLAFEATPFAAAELYDRFSHADAWVVYPEVTAVLDALRGRGLRLGVLGNWDERLPALLAELGLADFFDAVCHSSALGVAKPHPEAFRHVLSKLGVAPAEALHVGDQPLADGEGADGVGLHSLVLDRKAGDTLEAVLERLEVLEPSVAGASNARTGS